MIRSIFKAYDVRGIYPDELDEKTAEDIARALTKYFHRGKILVGCDGRLSSPTLYAAVLRGIANQEVSIKNKTFIIHTAKFVIHASGLMTTPMLYFLVNHLKASGGIMVTASHNPQEYNGLKVVGPKAKPISGTQIYELYKKIY